MKQADYLGRILEQKRGEVAGRKHRRPLDVLRAMPAYGRQRRSLLKALASGIPALIAEIKRASPSRGVIRESIDVHAIALSYVHAGAAALSVLTDEPFFHGKLEYLAEARGGHEAPVLRKDFIIDAYQLHEACAFGADAVLLIVAALGASRLRELKHEAESLGLETLVEIHDEQELEALGDEPAALLGINNRNLMTFETTLDVTRRLCRLVPPGTVVVSESGIRDPADMQDLLRHGVTAALVGEAFMRAPDPGEALREFLQRCRSGDR